MDRAWLENALANVEGHVVAGRKHIADIRRHAAELERDGHDFAQARDLLATFESVQSTHIAHRDHLRAELQRLD